MLSVVSLIVVLSVNMLSVVMLKSLFDMLSVCYDKCCHLRCYYECCVFFIFVLSVAECRLC
jgi:hypothetical protein